MKPIGESRRRGKPASARVPARATILMAAALAAALVTGCATAAAGPFARGPLHGIVYDGRNQPVALASVRVDGGRAVTSDVNGRFTVPDVRHGQRSVHAEKPGYRAVTESVEFVQRTQVLYLRVASANDLVDAAIAALGEGRYTDAGSYAAEAIAVAPEHRLGRFVAALAAIGAGDPRVATELLGWFGEPAPDAVVQARVIAARAVDQRRDGP